MLLILYAEPLAAAARSPHDRHIGAVSLCDNGPMAGTRLLLLVCSVAVALMLLACGNESVVEPRNEAADSSSGGWWILDAEGFTLLDGGLTTRDIAESTGHLWTLEYSNGANTLQLSAWKADSQFVQMVDQYQPVGVSQIARFNVTLRRSAGEPSDDIPPSVMAVWPDGDRFVAFGGAALSEEQVRSFLQRLRRVTHDEWNSAVEALPEQQTAPTPTDLAN